MPHWIWEHPHWPRFTWDESHIAPVLIKARFAQGQLLGSMSSLLETTQQQFNYQCLSQDMLDTSAIEGELLDKNSVRSSIANRLGIQDAGLSTKGSPYIEGLSDMLLDATMNYQDPLTVLRLKQWQASLFPLGYAGIKKIIVGDLRGEGDMQIISGRPGKMNIHYQAPPRRDLEPMLATFIQWFASGKTPDKQQRMDGLLRAGLAHLWFEILHPFDDGNGRVGRAIMDMALAQDEQLNKRFYSVSSMMMRERKHYYASLATATQGDMDISQWLEWFLYGFIQAVESSQQLLAQIKRRAKFWQHHQKTALNPRQKKVLQRMLEEEVFAGGMTTKKYANLTRTSRATAYREIQDLVNKQCLYPLAAKGRSSAYGIVDVV